MEHWATTLFAAGFVFFMGLASSFERYTDKKSKIAFYVCTGASVVVLSQALRYVA